MQINLKVLKDLSENDIEKLMEIADDSSTVNALVKLIENNLIALKVEEFIKLHTNNTKEANEKVIAKKIAIQGALELLSELKAVFKAMKKQQ